MVPRAVLMKSGLVSVNTARQVNTAQSKTTVNAARPMSFPSKIAHSTIKRPINKNTTLKNSNINQRVNTVRGNNVNTARPKAVINATRPKAVLNVWHVKATDKEHGLYLTNSEENRFYDRGYVALEVNPKGGNITGCRFVPIKTVFLFNDMMFVLSPNFKLTDESHVLLKVPRKNNMYSVDLKNIVSKGGLTCLFAKATSDESKLWHRRPGHLNFKTMNKLVKGNLVRGLPSKLFENDQTCVTCQKGKQHRASCKSKTENSTSLPLHLLHMDLFGPTFVKSLMKKMYCLVVTDDSN
ncbi:putative ribonuclease H-like domain-containing protein [Tanacetum coccineum]